MCKYPKSWCKIVFSVFSYLTLLRTLYFNLRSLSLLFCLQTISAWKIDLGNISETPLVCFCIFGIFKRFSSASSLSLRSGNGKSLVFPRPFHAAQCSAQYGIEQPTGRQRQRAYLPLFYPPPSNAQWHIVSKLQCVGGYSHNKEILSLINSYHILS